MRFFSCFQLNEKQKTVWLDLIEIQIRVISNIGKKSKA